MVPGLGRRCHDGALGDGVFCNLGDVVGFRVQGLGFRV